VDIADWARRGAVVFSPHPDDEVIGCGGTLLDIAQRNGAVTIVQVTDGSDSAAFIEEPEAVRRQVRLDEAEAVARRIGARELVCLRADNRALRATPELRARFREILERSGAGLVFAPTFTDFHPDHQTVLEILVDAMREIPADRPAVALYEVWGLVTPTHLHPVRDHIDDIEFLLLLYETALKVDDYVHLVAERLLYHSYAELGEPGYVEAFEVVSGDRFVELGMSRRAGVGLSA
jgi:LmbE family N-acetylglucosaminyl deacetylase